MALLGHEIVPIRVLLALFKAGAVLTTFILLSLVTRPFAILGALLAMAYWGRISWSLNTPFLGAHAKEPRQREGYDQSGPGYRNIRGTYPSTRPINFPTAAALYRRPR